MSLSKQINILFWITLANFIAQIPYTIHLYGVGRLFMVNWGWAAMLFVLVLFLGGYFLFAAGNPAGYGMLLVFLVMEFLFYSFNEVVSAIHGYGILYHLRHDDPLLKVVFLIGFLNLPASGYFLFLLIFRRDRISA